MVIFNANMNPKTQPWAWRNSGSKSEACGPTSQHSGGLDTRSKQAAQETGEAPPLALHVTRTRPRSETEGAHVASAEPHF